jgi:DNA-binding response OmpR family regulator
MTKVMIVDDDLMIADCLEELLIDAGYDVCGVAGTYDEAIALGEEHRPDIGVIDLRLADGHCGTEIAATLRTRRRFGVLYSTGNPDHDLLRDAEGEGCIAKPYSAASLLAALRTVMERMSANPSNPKKYPLLGI